MAQASAPAYKTQATLLRPTLMNIEVVSPSDYANVKWVITFLGVGGRDMCGIAGWLLPSRKHLLEADLVTMRDTLTHRGPDEFGNSIEVVSQTNEQVALAHRRLSIIDLEGGSQPMSDEDAGVTISFNGEIYNFLELKAQLIKLGHEFHTKSDTEVLLHSYIEWGVDVPNHLRGQFAFAIWDSQKGRLLLARDHFGLKPLYLMDYNGGFAFASEAKALLALPKTSIGINTDVIPDYLRYRYAPSPQTLLEGIRKLMPGTFLVWEQGEVKEERYHKPADCVPRSERKKQDSPVSRFRELFEEAVRIRMVADVPYGAFLSGGIDSSAIVAMMTRHSSVPVKTFSVGFPESEFSELNYAKLISESFNCDHTELIIEPDDLMEHLPKLIHLRDSPVSEPSDIPIYLLAKRAREDVKMVLTGEGADEFLGGYEKHALEKPAWWYRSITPRFIHEGIFSPLIHSLPYRFQKWKIAAVNVGLRDSNERYPRWFGALSNKELSDFFAGDSKSSLLDSSHLNKSPKNSLLRSVLAFDQQSWLPDNLLERGDRMSMGHSLEARMPFMDHKLAEYISTLPDRYRVRGMKTKWMLRKAMKDVLPSQILKRSKVGFKVPVNEWFRGEMHGWLRSLLMSNESMTNSLYNGTALERVLNEHHKGRQNHEKLLWTLVNLELFFRQYA